METKWVLVERQQMSGRYVALRGVQFATKEAAEAHLKAMPNQRYASRLSIESRMVKPDDEQLRMHCQCCGRSILAKTGTIAHHGYTRPGSGWQTASCYGAKALPWEVDRSALARLIDFIRDTLKRHVASRAEAAAEKIPVSYSYPGPYDKARCKSPTLYKDVTRATFDEIKADPQYKMVQRSVYDFDGLKKSDLDSRDRQIASLKKDIAEFSKRFNSWKQTHKRVGNAWVAI